MHDLLPIAVAAGGVVLSLLLPPLIAAVLPPLPLPGDDGAEPRCEGYYPDAHTCLPLGSSRPSWRRRTRANARCPQWRIATNRGAAGGGWIEILSWRLIRMEELARGWDRLLNDMDAEEFARCDGRTDPPVRLRRERGMAPSRVEMAGEGVFVGNSEFRSDGGGREIGACWTDALFPHYIVRHGVRPSGAFEAFVASFDIAAFEAGLDDLRACARGGSDGMDVGDGGTID